jgi:hypothetical protein
MSSDDREVGRCERGLDRDLATRHDIPSAERSALRTQAIALDMAEADGSPDVVSRTNAVYLELRKAAGLTSGGASSDVWDGLLAEVTRATPGRRNKSKP